MSEAEVITLSEITGQSIAAVGGAVSNINSALVTKLQGQITLWDANHDDVDMTLKGEVNIETQNLLNAITKRVCTWLGFPVVNICSHLPGSVVVGSTLGW